MEGHLLLFEKFVETHGVPSAVVYHFSPDTLHRNATDVDKAGYLSRFKWVLGVEKKTYILPSYAFRTITRGAVAPACEAVPRGRWPLPTCPRFNRLNAVLTRMVDRSHSSLPVRTSSLAMIGCRCISFDTPIAESGELRVSAEQFLLSFTPDPDFVGTETIEVKLWNQTNVDDVVTVELTLTFI